MAKKKGTSPILVGLMTILALSVATLLLVLTALFSGKVGHVQRESYVDNGVLGQIATEQVTIKINMENCMMLVGTKMQATATIYPSGSQSGVNWTSSDDEVLEVDKDGNVVVHGTGIIALTANFGDAYDSIAIECIATEQDAVLNLPNYKLFTSGEPATKVHLDGKEPGNNGTTTVDPSKDSTMKDSQTTSKNDGTTKATETSKETTKATQSATQATTKATQATTATKPTQTTTAAKPTKATQAETTLYTLDTTTEYGGTKVLSTEVASRLETYGFSKYLDNTYVYGDGDQYLGEVIITSNMTHIYIKQRSADFDSAVLSVLTELLPDSNGNVWNMYTSASTDQTVKVDGRMVRVVVGGSGGHSQIVIYN